MRRLLYILLFVPLLLSGQTTYYIKNGGNDGAAGTSDGTDGGTTFRLRGSRPDAPPIARDGSQGGSRAAATRRAPTAAVRQ